MQKVGQLTLGEPAGRILFGVAAAKNYPRDGLDLPQLLKDLLAAHLRHG
jgi:hypothetical protein